MPRIPRIVIPGIPHHIVQRGNRRQQVFFNNEDRIFYIKLLRKYSDLLGLAIWVYCLMKNHLHLIGVPDTEKGLSEVMSIVNRKYALRVNLREDWSGCLWQNRFYSCPLDFSHTIASARYIERNPVRAKIVEHPEDYPWSSARAHVENTDDSLIVPSSLAAEIPDWRAFINQDDPSEIVKKLRKNIVTGRPLGDDAFIERLERLTGRVLRVEKAGRRPKQTTPGPVPSA
jgi:putative transposase